jgi:hypothetical protein
MLLIQCLFGPRSCSGSPLFHRGHHRSGTHGVGRALRYRRHYGKHGREDAWTCKGSLHGKASISSLGRAAGCKTSIFALSASWPPRVKHTRGRLDRFPKDYNSASAAPPCRTDRCGPSAEVIAQCEEDLGSERLQQSPPRLARQDRAQRAHRLGSDDRNALGLPRQREELLVARGITLPHCGEALILIAKKENFPPAMSWFYLHYGNALRTARWESRFIRVPMVLASPGFIAFGKGAYFALFEKL